MPRRSRRHNNRISLAEFLNQEQPSFNPEVITLSHDPIEIGYSDLVSIKITLVSTNLSNEKDTVREMYKRAIEQFNTEVRINNAEYILSTELNMHIQSTYEGHEDNRDKDNDDYTLRNNNSAAPHITPTDTRSDIMDMVERSQLDFFDTTSVAMTNDTYHYEITIVKINYLVLNLMRVQPDWGSALFMLEDLDMPKYLKKALTIPYNTDEYCLIHALFMEEDSKRMSKDEIEVYTNELKGLFEKGKGFLFNKKNIKKIEDYRINVELPRSVSQTVFQW
jgi:hypothetical protein